MEKRKQLLRSNTDRMIAGVCGGLAEYFNIDPVLMRFLFVILGFSGVGVLIYIIAIIIIPERGNQSSKSDISEKINEAAAEVKNTFEKNKSHYRAEQIFGLIILFTGLSFLSDKFMPWFHVINFWPILLIVLGLAMIFKTERKG